MPTQAIGFKRTQKYKVALFSAIVGFAALMIVATLYVENEPALSVRAIGASMRRVVLTVFLSPIRAIPTDHSKQAAAIPVLTYHRLVGNSNDVNNVTKSNFRNQMIALKRAGWQTVTLQEFEEFMEGKRTLPEKSFMITFDDGAKESYYPSDPVLAALGYSAVNFIIVAASEIPGTTYYLNPKEIRHMINSGRWSIGSHSHDGHRPYPTDVGDVGIFFADRLWLTDKNRLETPEEFRVRVQTDLTRAKQELEATYEHPMQHFAFPLGNETGITGANNYPEGASITEDQARSIYKYGYLQTSNQQFTTNFPLRAGNPTDIASQTRAMLATNFIVRRIHVDHDWDGERLLLIMENGLMKSVPYEDDFSSNRGWITSWGEASFGRNNFVLNATEGLSSASTFLNGSELWDNYSFDVTANWDSGHLFALADVIDADTYDACIFSPGEIRIQSSVDGKTRTVATVKNSAIAYAQNARVGVRVRGAVVECTWNYAAVAEAYTRNHSGGIGIQTWNPTLGAAKLQVSSVIVRSLTTAKAE